MAGIYLHIPFCKQACYYCDFHFSVNRANESEMVSAIAEELRLRKNYTADDQINTIYFGGGTPSLLNQSSLDLLMHTLHDNFPIDENAEVTLEANPDDLTAVKLQDLRSIGINRLSVGIQSFDDDILKFLHRAHDRQAAIQSIGRARAAGFGNISIDLIYGIPDQTDAQWQRDIGAALELSPEHISSYSLTIEEKTVFGNWAKKGRLNQVEDEVVAGQLELLMRTLSENDYHQYEVSNFARKGHISRHNSNYWKQEKYLGVGPSAHSYDGLSRQHNVSNNYLYTSGIRSGMVPFELEVLTREDLINEYLLTTLRTSWGCDLDYLVRVHDHDLVGKHNEYISTLLLKGLAVLDNKILKLTDAGKLLADKISSDLFLLPRST